MQIHELNTFTGTPGSGDWLAMDNGTETMKVEVTQIKPVIPYSNYYGTSSTEASTTTKVVTCSEFELKTGAMIAVKFDNANTATGTCYLNVNSTGAKRIRRANGSTQAVNNIWDAGDIVTFVYDGSSWIITGTECDIDASVFTLFTSLGWTQD